MMDNQKKAELIERAKSFIPINKLSDEAISQLLSSSNILDIKKTKFIFKQGDVDDFSYYLLEGEVELYANKNLNSTIEGNTNRANYALAQLQPRQFSVKAKTNIQVLQISRDIVDRMLMTENNDNSISNSKKGSGVDIVEGVDDEGDWMTKMLQSELFAHMPTANIHKLFVALESVEYKKGDVVIKQGDPGEDYYVISEGTCEVSRKTSPDEEDVKLAELVVGDSFGEEALISDSTRNATVTMLTAGVLMRLTKDLFGELVKKPNLNAIKQSETSFLIEEGAKWVDIRYPDEHKESSIKGSANIPLKSLRKNLDKFEKSRKYIFYCDSGGRSSVAAFLLSGYGFNVYYLDGGLINNPEISRVSGVDDIKSKEAPKEVSKEVKKEVRKEVKKDDVYRIKKLNDDLENADINLNKAKSQQSGVDSAQDKINEDNKRKLEAEKNKIELEKEKVEREVEQRIKREQLRANKIKEEMELKIQEEKKKLEDIYNKNAIEMAKLKKTQQEIEEKTRKDRIRLEQQLAAAREKAKEAEHKMTLEVAKKEQEAQSTISKERKKTELLRKEAEESKRKLEEQIRVRELKNQKIKKDLEAKAKAKIEAERRKISKHLAAKQNAETTITQMKIRSDIVEKIKRQAREAKAKK